MFLLGDWNPMAPAARPRHMRRTVTSRAGARQPLGSQRWALRAVLDVGLGAIGAARGFAVPIALRVLPLDAFARAGNTLLGGSVARRGQRLGMGGERFGEDAVDRIGPAVVVADDLVGDVRHRCTCRIEGQSPA